MGDLLQMKQGSPALIIERVSYLEGDVPLEYVVSVYRGDRYSFHVYMQRNGQSC
jgi:GntR family transcriptional regulator